MNAPPPPPPRKRGGRLPAALASLALASCIVVPQTQSVYDPECKTQTRQITLEAAYVGGFHSCAGDGCLAMLAAYGFVTAASVVVSGSIAIVGNVVYWLERQGRCLRPAASPALPSAAATAPPDAAARPAASAPK